MLKGNLKIKITSVAVMILIIALTLTVFAFAGCKNISSDNATLASENSSTTTTAAAGSTVETSQVSSESTTTTKTQTPIEVTDGIGNKVTLDKPAQKIIVLSPSVLEIFSGLNAMDKVIEVDSWSVKNNEPLAKGFKGAGDANGLNLETITKLNPDLVIVVGYGPKDDSKKLSELGFKIYMSNSTSLEGTYAEIENIGKIIGKAEEGKTLSTTLKTGVEDIYSKVKDLAEDKKPKVFFMVWNDPMMSAGKNTFINELIEKAGGINIVAKDGLSDWPEYSLEKLIKNNPDVMITPIGLAANILKDKKFSTIKAVADKKVYSIPDNSIARPNQNVIKGLSMLSMAIHPEIFGEFKVIE